MMTTRHSPKDIVVWRDYILPICQQDLGCHLYGIETTPTHRHKCQKNRNKSDVDVGNMFLESLHFLYYWLIAILNLLSEYSFEAMRWVVLGVLPIDEKEVSGS